MLHYEYTSFGAKFNNIGGNRRYLENFYVLGDKFGEDWSDISCKK
jgi:hypothetical protein